MPAFCFDASGLVKRYVRETGTAWVTGLLAPAAGHLIYISRITGVEVVSALVRRQRGGTLSPAALSAALSQFHRDYANAFQLIGVTPQLIGSAMTLAERHALRGYDAVQLAVALRVDGQRRRARRSRMTVISADAALNAAATLEGLLVDDPNNHP